MLITYPMKKGTIGEERGKRLKRIRMRQRLKTDCTVSGRKRNTSTQK